MRFPRRLLIAASLLLSVLLLSVSIPAQQQPAQSAGKTIKCGGVECAADCDCQLTICDKSVNPDCVDVGVCVNCGSPPSMAVQNLIAGGVVVAVIAVVAIVVSRRRRRARNGDDVSSM